MHKRYLKGRSQSVSKPYEVGFKRPPAAFRFPKGVSGNPGGKRKRSKAPDLKTQLQSALNKPVTIHIGERQKTLSKGAAGIEHLVDQWAQGDRNARRDVIALCDDLGVDLTDREALQGALEDALSAEDETLLADFVRRHGGQYPVRADAAVSLPPKNENLLSPPADDPKLLTRPENLTSTQKIQQENPDE